jgi:RNA polymerase sigma factor (sigma-70 family)
MSADEHEQLRGYLFAIAYRMLGSVSEAEDVVQEAFLRYEHAGAEADSPRAYLASVTTRLAIDQLRSARAGREVYTGEWLPEPLVDDEALRHAETADSLSLTFLHLLEKLSPVERAVFLLREVFDYPSEGGGGNRRQEPGQLPPDPRPRAPPHPRGQAPLRGLRPRARRGRPPLPRRLGRRRDRGADRTARPRCDRLRRRRRQGTCGARPARRRRKDRESADRLGPAGARTRARLAPGDRQRRARPRLLWRGRTRPLGRRPRDRRRTRTQTRLASRFSRTSYTTTRSSRSAGSGSTERTIRARPAISRHCPTSSGDSCAK